MIRVNKTEVRYEGTKAHILAEITLLLRELYHKEQAFTEEDFERMKDMVFKSEKQLKAEAWAQLAKDLDDFIEFLEKIANEHESDD